MKTKLTFAMGALAVAGTAMITASSHAGLVEKGTYRLGNHPDANQDPPAYGLRLDELFDVNVNQHDVFTFDFEADGAAMFLDYNGESIHIYGTAFGGLDVGGEYDPDNSSFVNIDFTYSESILADPDDDVLVTSDMNGSGSITWVDADEEISLAAYSGDNDFSFRFGDEDDDNGHRGFEGLSGWGWLTHGDREHIGASDWIFTAELVPAPGALAFLGLGLLGRRRRRQA